MSITKHEAKYVSLLVWGWLKENPEKEKEDCPLVAGLEKYDNHCPMCSYFFNDKDMCTSMDGEVCPLIGHGGCSEYYTDYVRGELTEKIIAIDHIYAIIENWDIQ
jgi:hypothetical protein